MSEIISRLAVTSVLISLLSIFGCSSSDDSGGAAVPTGAVTITEANATQVVTEAVITGSALLDIVEAATAVEIDQALTARDIIDLVADKTKNISGTSAISTPIGVIVPINETCTDGGTVTGSSDETPTSSSGTVTFTNCSELGITLNGTINFNSTNDVPGTGDFTDTLTGNISGTDGVETVSLTGLSFSESGNTISGDFTISSYTYSVDFSGGGGFKTELTASIVGIDGAACPDSGGVLVSGADSTQARGTIVPGISVDNDVKIEFNDGSGTFTEVAGSPVPCTTMF